MSSHGVTKIKTYELNVTNQMCPHLVTDKRELVINFPPGTLQGKSLQNFLENKTDG